jgi:hypothetical protein
MGVKTPTSKQAEILTALEPFGYRFEIGIKRDMVTLHSYVVCFEKYYTIEEAVDRYYNVYALHTEA